MQRASCAILTLDGVNSSIWTSSAVLCYSPFLTPIRKSQRSEGRATLFIVIPAPIFVIPAQAGIHSLLRSFSCLPKKTNQKKGTPANFRALRFGRPPVNQFKLGRSDLRHELLFNPSAFLSLLKFPKGPQVLSLEPLNPQNLGPCRYALYFSFTDVVYLWRWDTVLKMEKG
jgi:hypothetical protein